MSVSSGSQLGTPVKQAKQTVTSTKSLPPLASDCKKLLQEQHQRLWLKHQQDLDLIDDIKSYVKSRLNIERDYCSALLKLGKQHSNFVAKKFSNLDTDPVGSTTTTPASAGAAQAANTATTGGQTNKGAIDSNNNNNLSKTDNSSSSNNTNRNNPSNINSSGSGNRKQQLSNNNNNNISDSDAADDRLQKRLATNGVPEPEPSTLYKVWCEHINRLISTSKYKSEQFEQLLIVVERLKDIRQHKANIGKKCLDNYLKRIHEDLIAGMVEIEKSRKLYYEDESQAKKARENEERIKKKKSGLLTKFTDLQLKKEKTMAQREANDIQSTQARNDYIMSLAAGNAHLEHYYQQDLPDIMQTVDDGVLDQCKYFMATLSECDMNSLKDSLSGAQYWSKMISLSGSHVTNNIFLRSKQSSCLQDNLKIPYEPCNNDPIYNISLEHNADYALQHEIDKWFTWFKKECRNLSHLMHHLEMCQRAVAEGKRTIEINGQTTDDLESKIIDLKQQIRKSEAAKLKAQARLKVIKEGGMQIDEWSTVESEIRADMARIQESINSRHRGSGDVQHQGQNFDQKQQNKQQNKATANQKRTKFSHKAVDPIDESRSGRGCRSTSRGDSDDSQLKEESRSKQQKLTQSESNTLAQQSASSQDKPYFAALADPNLAWSDSYDVTYTVWPKHRQDEQRDDHDDDTNQARDGDASTHKYQFLGTAAASQHYHNQGNTMTVQSSSPLSAIVDGVQTLASPYQQSMNDAYKSDYECDYNRSGGNNAQIDHNSSTSGSAEPYQQRHHHQSSDWDSSSRNEGGAIVDEYDDMEQEGDATPTPVDAAQLLGKRVITLYKFEKANDGDLSFEENEILMVLELNDANWVKARNVETGQEGFIPVSYVQVHDGPKPSAGQVRPTSASSNDSSASQQQKKDRSPHSKLAFTESEASAWDTQDLQQPSSTDEQLYGRALYDYKPDDGAQEDDGLPHLSLKQGDLLKILDQSSDDGWWTVERERDCARGHVPSMLVEEIYEGDDEADENDVDNEDDEDSYGAENGSVRAMPTFQAPKLITNDNGRDSAPVLPPPLLDGPPLDGDEITKPPPDYCPPKPASLAPTAFVIIQPTPEIESRRLTDDVAAENDAIGGGSTSEKTDRPPSAPQPTTTDIDEPPTSSCPTSYSVINESFILEGPTRRPHHVPEELTPHHDTPTIMEEPYDSTTDQNETRLHDDDIKAANYEPLSEVDSVPEMPAPPSLVVDSFEDDLAYDNDEDLPAPPNFDEDPPENATTTRSASPSPTSNPSPTPVNTGTVEQGSKMNQILIDRANSFSEQITREAIKMAVKSGDSTN